MAKGPVSGVLSQRKLIIVSILLLIVLCAVLVRHRGSFTSDNSDNDVEPTSSPGSRSPSVMLDNVIYYDTGTIVSIDVSEDEYIGFITSVISITEMPYENGQTNISFMPSLEGAPLVKYENGIALRKDIGWVYFEPSEND